MMPMHIRDLITIGGLGAARRLLALERVLPLVAEHPVDGLSEALDDAIAHEKRVLAMEAARRAPIRSALHEAEARDLDQQLDRAVSALRDLLVSTVQVHPPPAQDHAQQLLEALFPAGVAPVTGLPYVEQHGALREMFARLQRDPQLSASVAALYLSGPLQHLEALNEAYGAALSATGGEEVTHEAYARAERQGRDTLAAIVARILGAYPTDAPADLSARSQLLEPIALQQAEARALRRSKRNGTAPEGPASPEPEPDSLETSPQHPHTEQAPATP